jgi:biopolymer transport protein ExbD
MAGSSGGSSPVLRKGKFGSAYAAKRARIEIIPLIDVMFFLLASFMMVSLSMSKMKSVKIALPQASASQKDLSPDMFNITVNKAGETYVGKQLLAMPQVLNLLTNAYRGNTNIHVYVSGDRDATHGSVIRVLNTVRTAGITRVQFATAPMEKANP